MTASLAAVVLCAGKGTRMKSRQAQGPASHSGQAPVAYPLKRALELGASPVVPVVGHQAARSSARIRTHFPGGAPALRAPEGAAGHGGRGALGAGGARGLPGRVLILYGDVPLLRRETLDALVTRYDKAGALLALVTTHARGSHRLRPRHPRGRQGARASSSTRTARAEQRQVRECNAGIYWWTRRSSGRRWRNVQTQQRPGRVLPHGPGGDGGGPGPVAAVDADSTRRPG